MKRNAPLGWLYSKDPADAARRRQQAEIDNDIEGLSRDAGIERLFDEMDAAGVPIGRERIKRLKAYLRARAKTIEAMKAAERGEVTTVGHPRNLLKSLNRAKSKPRG
jgi:hypothetical protein